MKIQNAIWFSNNRLGCIGIVYGTDDFGNRKAYIGIGDGMDEGIDVDKIAKNGAKIYPNMLQEVIDFLANSNHEGER
jgi:hypothetical protein